MSELDPKITSYPQVLLNAKVKPENKNKEMSITEISKIEEELAGQGRVLVVLQEQTIG